MPTPELAAAIDWEVRLTQRITEADGLGPARQVIREMWAERAGDHLRADAAVEQVDADGVSAEWVTTDAAGPAVVLYVHGGGFTFGAADLERETLARLGAVAGARTLAVDYRLAPEHAAPAALEDVLTVYRWLLAGGTPASRIVVIGESAGGLLATMALVAARDRGVEMPGALILWSPFADLTVSGASMTGNAATDPFVNREVALASAGAYLQGQDPTSASPIFTDLTGLPPTLVQAGTNEAFLDDARRLVDAARAVGVDVRLQPFDDVVHMWHGFPELPAAATAVQASGEFIAAHTTAAVSAQP